MVYSHMHENTEMTQGNNSRGFLDNISSGVASFGGSLQLKAL